MVKVREKEGRGGGGDGRGGGLWDYAHLSAVVSLYREPQVRHSSRGQGGQGSSRVLMESIPGSQDLRSAGHPFLKGECHSVMPSLRFQIHCKCDQHAVPL